jgi:hypothetical protein
MYADWSADFTELISVYLRTHLCDQREKVLFFKLNHYPKFAGLSLRLCVKFIAEQRTER